jgi:hypothetical protein
MNSEIKHVTFLVQWYCTFWQEKRPGNTSYALLSNSSRLKSAGTIRRQQYTAGFRGAGSA